MEHPLRYVPFGRNLKIRTTIGFILLLLSTISAQTILNKGRIEVIFSITAVAWMFSVFLTDKYVHKYPQRYFTYLIASHMKAAIIMAFFLWIIGRVVGIVVARNEVLWAGFIFFVFADALASFPRRRDIPDKPFSVGDPALYADDFTGDRSTDPGYIHTDISSIDMETIVSQIHSNLDEPLVEFIKKNLPDVQGVAGNVLVLDDVSTTEDQSQSAPVRLLIGHTCINDVLRLNQFLMVCVKQITMGGFIVVRYMPLENVIKDLKRRYVGLRYWIVFILHFIWYRAIPKIPWLDRIYFSSLFSWLDPIHLSLVKKRNRALSKAEVWGRLSFCGMRVVAESKGDGEVYIIAQRVSLPVQNKIPSYYLIASLEKVGLDGQIIRMHKIRTMYPFSEFIQQRIYENHGLAPTGKFASDFRLTGYGRFLRKFWLDELPQIFDWLGGDIKLVGLRATSLHFLSLYPKEFYELYIQIKPGLIPPVLDESINSFDQIVEVEFAYLNCYLAHPIRTDIRYLCKTFTDIVFRGVRSK
jgi:lipopolysaccharide/colanic/teichoic acid biosynthesis glycosyltransferase